MSNFFKKAKENLGLNSKELKQEIEKLTQKNEELANMLTPEQKEVSNYTDELNNLKLHIQNLNIENEKIKQTILERQNTVNDLEHRIIVAEEAIELELFSLYTPRYNFLTVDAYKNRLAEIREMQKKFIKNKTAAIGGDNFTFNNSKPQGKKLIDNVKKNMLSTFNLECEIATANVKFSNITAQEKRIEKAFEKTNNLGNIFTVQIVREYKQLKMEELFLAYEYQKKVEDEKEEKREERERLKEEARAAKEIEERKKELEKEQKHYTSALDKFKEQLVNCTDETEKAILEEKIQDIQTNLDEVNKGIEDVDYRQANKRAGYVYIISNLGAFGENVYKIGMTRRLDPMERVNELGDASVPFKFDVHSLIFADDAPALESALHKHFDNKKVNMVNYRREFFEADLDEIQEVVKQNFDQTVEFIKIKEAEEYRESLKIKENLGL